MKVRSGCTVVLDGNELACAVDAYLVAHGISVTGPRTVLVFLDGVGMLARNAAVEVCVDPSGKLVDNR